MYTFTVLSMALTEGVNTDRDGGEQTFRYISDNDTDEEDDGIEPVVSEDESDDEEWYSKEHSHSGDDVDEMLDLTGNRGLSHF